LAPLGKNVNKICASNVKFSPASGNMKILIKFYFPIWVHSVRYVL
jgi:hypothetical protein